MDIDYFGSTSRWLSVSSRPSNCIPVQSPKLCSCLIDHRRHVTPGLFPTFILAICSLISRHLVFSFCSSSWHRLACLLHHDVLSVIFEEIAGVTSAFRVMKSFQSCSRRSLAALLCLWQWRSTVVLFNCFPRLCFTVVFHRCLPRTLGLARTTAHLSRSPAVP